MTAFEQLSLHSKLLRALEKLNFSEPTEVQGEVIPKALAGNDLLVSAQTGSGKTAAFLLPMLHQFLANESPNTATRALILLPTRELALQTQKTFQQLAQFTSITCGLIIGGEAFKHQIATLRKNPEVIIATPGRLVEHIGNNNTDFTDLEMLVLDEADRMLDMGFAVDMNTIAQSCNKQRHNWLFSATLQHKGMESILGLFSQPVSIELTDHRQQHGDIIQQRILADDKKHKEKLVAALIEQDQPRKTLVFCKTRIQCEQLGHVLRYLKIKASYIHGEVAQNQRKQIMNAFRKGEIEVLVATDLAARGLDVEDVDLVINYSVAPSGDDHLHRIGRTGRAGAKGKAVTFVSADEWRQMSSIERYLKISFEHRVIEGLKADYKGPKKLKKSGKIVGKKKKKTDLKKPAKAKSKAKAKVKSNAPKKMRPQRPS